MRLGSISITSCTHQIGRRKKKETEERRKRRKREGNTRRVGIVGMFLADLWRQQADQPSGKDRSRYDTMLDGPVTRPKLPRHKGYSIDMMKAPQQYRTEVVTRQVQVVDHVP